MSQSTFGGHIYLRFFYLKYLKEIQKSYIQVRTNSVKYSLKKH